MLKKWQYLSIPLILVILISSCQTSTQVISTPSQEVNESGGKRTLTICLGYEPESLYLYGVYSQSAWSVLEAIYDGPINIVQFEPHPVILTKMPSFENGDVQIITTTVKQGDKVINSQGNLVLLDQGEKVLPSGCTTSDCVITWDGISELHMDQIIVTYHLQNNIRWSDGHRLTAADSIYSFYIAADVNTPGMKTHINHTHTYQAVDDFTIQWMGQPGFLTQKFENYLWHPLPEHAWNKFTPLELLVAEESTRRPIGWGAYVIQEWQPGQYIQLAKNPYYATQHEGLPKFDTLIYKFFNSEGDANIEAVLSENCDFTNQTTLMIDQAKRLSLPSYYYSVPKEEQFISQGPLIEYVFFNTSEVKQTSEEMPILNNIQVRQAIAYCLDRPTINKELFEKYATVPLTNLSPASPFYLNELEPYDFDSEKGQQILDDVGWIDDDRDPITPRVAYHVASILDGTKLSLRMITIRDGWEEKAAILIKQSLLECGIATDLKLFQEDEFFDPQGPFFQSDFDLALFSWMSGEISPCYLFSEPAQQILYSETPSIDVNVSRYVNPEFDALCKASLQPLVTRDEQEFLQQEIQTILNRDLPFLPLFTYYQADVARNDFCPYELDTSARSDLQNIESMDYGVHCQP